MTVSKESIVLMLFGCGIDAPQIARHVKVSQKEVRRILQAHADADFPNRPTDAESKVEALLKAWVPALLESERRQRKAVKIAHKFFLVGQGQGEE